MRQNGLWLRAPHRPEGCSERRAKEGGGQWGVGRAEGGNRGRNALAN